MTKSDSRSQKGRSAPGSTEAPASSALAAIHGPVLRKKNYVWLGIALGVIVIGFVALALGDITLAPILLVAGYLVLIPLAILKR